MDELRSWWEVPSISHFCSLFRSAFDLTDFDIEDLEDAFLESQREEGSEFLTDLVCKLLNGCYQRKDVTVLNYDLYVKDVLKYKWQGTGNPIAEKSEFKELTLREKVDLVHSICEYRFDAEDVPDLLKGFEGDNMRVEPLGKDKEGATYWYFYGSRLYKEDPPPKKEVSKEEKKAKEKQRRKELEKKRKEEKKQRKVEKQKKKALKKTVKKPKVPEPVVEADDDGNIRRSGRLRIKKDLKKYVGESSESSSSSEDESLQSSSETEVDEPEEVVEEEEPEKPSKKKGSKKTPARKTPAKKTPAKKTPAKKTPAKIQEESTPSGRPQRQSARQKGKSSSKTSQQNDIEDTPELDSAVRRSGRIKGRRSLAPPKGDSDTEDGTKDDIDSGHESGITDDDDDTKSETSKMSVKSSISKSSHKATPVGRRITLPRASANIEKGSADTEEEEGEEEGEEENLEQIEEEEDQNEDDIDEQKLNDAEKDEEENKQNKEKAEKETEEISDVNTEEVNNKESNGPEDEKSQSVPLPETTVDCRNIVKDLNDKDEVNMEVEESTSTDNSKTNDSNNTGEASPIDKDKNEADNGKLEDQSNEQQGTNEVETMETEDNIDSCVVPEGKSEEGALNENQNNITDDLNSKVETVPDIIKSEDQDKLEKKQEISDPAEEKEDKTSNEMDVEFKTENQSPVKEIGSETKSAETINTEENEDETTKCEQTKVENEIKNDDANNMTDIKQEDQYESDITGIKQEDLKSEIKEESVKVEDDGQENQNEDEMETEEKEKEDIGPKTTLGKQKTFSSVGPAVPPTPSKSDTRWHMICSTLDDWINLAEGFSNSQVRCEKAMCKLINEDFLPVLPEIIEAREKERNRRLLELDVRRSNRITLKMKEKIEQEKILAEALALEEKEKLRTEEERRLKEEQQKLEEEIRLREERMKAREERANRLSMREVRSRLIAEGKEIPPELLYTATNKYNDDYDSDDSRNDLKTDEDYNNLTRLVEAMKVHRDSWPFLEPVTDEVAPGYSDVIKRPMDLAKIAEKVKKRDYKSTQHFLSDFRLMFNNCKRFNGPDSEFTECAKTMEGMMKKYRKRFLMDDPGNNSYYQDKDFTLSVKGSKQADKKYRPRRAASSRAMETVHKALASSEEEESDSEVSDEDSEPSRKRRKPTEFPATQSSHQSLLLQEMIQMKRQREKNLAASALQNHQIITRGPERIRVQNPQGGVTIIPKNELPTKGLLKLAATREIKRKVDPQFSEMVDLSKKDPGLSVSANSAVPGPGRIKTIRIVAPNAPTTGATSTNAVKETAESVKVSPDGFLIIGGKNSGIKVSNNTKIVIQPPGTTPTASPSAQGREILIKKIPTPSGMKELPGTPSPQFPRIITSNPTTKPSVSRPPAILSVSSGLQINNSPGNVPTVVRQHQVLNKGLNSSSGIVTQTPQSFLASNQSNVSAQNTASLQLKQKMMLQKQQQQNGTNMQSPPPKVIRLSTSNPNSVMQSQRQMSIEDRLREPNLDRVSENVVKSVNIAGDILDSYYSVLNNSTKSNPPPTQTVKVSMESQPATKLVRSVHQTHVSPDIKSLLIQSMVNNKTIASSNSTALHQLNQTCTPAANGSLTQRPVGVANTHELVQNNVGYGASSNSTLGGNVITISTVQLSSSVPAGSVGQSVVGQSVGHSAVGQSVGHSDVGQMVGQSVVGHNVGHTPSTTYVQNTSHTLTHPSPQNTAQLPVAVSASTNMTPIEALFTGNAATDVISNQQHMSLGHNVQVPVSTPMLSQTTIQSELLKPVPSNLRQNVFDMFGTDNTTSVNNPGQDPGPEFNPELPSKELLKGFRAPSTGTVNFGSPLKTISVMEALKSKLSQSPKTEQQQTIIRKSAPEMNGMGVNENVVSNACVPPNPVVTSVLTPCSPPACTYSSRSSTNSTAECKTELLSQPIDNMSGTGTETHRKGLNYDCNGNVLNYTDDIKKTSKEIYPDAFAGMEVDTTRRSKQRSSVVKTEPSNNEVELCRYQFDSQADCWQMVKKETEDNLEKQDEGLGLDNKNIRINEEYQHGTDIEEDSTQSKIQEGNDVYKKNEPKSKNMYVIMIPNSNSAGSNESASVTQIPAQFPHHERMKYRKRILQEQRSLLVERNIPNHKRSGTFPPEGEFSIASHSLEPFKDDSESKNIGNVIKSKSLGKVHYEPMPSRRFYGNVQKYNPTAPLPGSVLTKMSKSTSDLSTDCVTEVRKDTCHKSRIQKASTINQGRDTVKQARDEDSDIEKYLNEVRAKQKAFRVTTGPIKTYQLCATSQSEVSFPKSLSLKDIDVVKTTNVPIKRGRRQVYSRTKNPPQSGNRSAQRQKRRQTNTNRNSSLANKHLTRGLTGDERQDNELDNSLTCDEEFFTSEVLSNLFPPNLGDGDSESDNVFKDIEHELFDLQDFPQQPPTHQQWNHNVQSHTLQHPYVNLPGAHTNTVHANEQSVRVVLPDVLGSSNVHQTSQPTVVHSNHTNQYNQRRDLYGQDTLLFSPTSLLNIGNTPVVSSNTHQTVLQHLVPSDVNNHNATVPPSHLQHQVEIGNTGTHPIAAYADVSGHSMIADGLTGPAIPSPLKQSGEPPS